MGKAGATFCSVPPRAGTTSPRLAPLGAHFDQRAFAIQRNVKLEETRTEPNSNRKAANREEKLCVPCPHFLEILALLK
jgi:hypothetical protein